MGQLRVSMGRACIGRAKSVAVNVETGLSLVDGHETRVSGWNEKSSFAARLKSKGKREAVPQSV